MPSQNKIDIRKNQIFLGFDNLDREAVNRPGNQPPEIYQIKTYTPGDSIRNIHWKLTARMDELMSKEYMDEVGTELFFFIDLRSSDSSPKSWMRSGRLFQPYPLVFYHPIYPTVYSGSA